MALDPHHCRITIHAYQRYASRRNTIDDWEQVDRNMRDLLGRVAHRNPPIVRKNGHSCRLYNVGELTFVMSVDNCTVITVYPQKRAQPQKRRGRRAEENWRLAEAY